MNRKIQKLWAILTGRRKIVQTKREKRYLKSLEVFDHNFHQHLIKLQFEAQTPDEFVQKVNNLMSNVYHFKFFKLKDVKAFNVFTSGGCEFIHTIYALVKPYGVFYVVVDTCEVFFKFSETLNWQLKEAETFRIYEQPNCSSTSQCNIFYQCKLRRGTVYVHGFFKEWQNTNGDFETRPFNDRHNKKFPIKFDKIIL